ncbi:presenilin-like protein At2g29900 [Oryza brachyantha]|uniref:presenilin-like protein At2g29900 n=1 Tax=Oryza brachyantha TaxID=4533 RepID=UPI001AD9DA5B|nr:presenilin-like protein At2g29900 [Oryza brachyantha]
MADAAAAATVPGEAASSSATVLDSLGEDITRIVTPVSTCMLLVVLLVSLLSSPSSPSPLSAAFTAAGGGGTGTGNGAGGDDITTALVTAVTFVVAVTAATFLLALLFYLRCTPCLRAYLGFSSLSVLLLLGGHVALLLLSRLRFPLDAVSFALLLPNAAAALALAALSPASVPIALHQAALVAIAVLTAFWFTLLPEWTTWALLVAMAVYDLAAVLLPGGPLRVLLELAIERNEEIPALVYEARPVDPRHGQNWRLWRDRQSGGELDANSTVEVIGEMLGTNLGANSAGNLGISATRSDEQVNLAADARNLRPGETSVANLSSDSSSSSAPVEVLPALPETRVSVAEMRVPLIQPQPVRSRDEDDDEDGIGLSSSGAIKLGLGDFIFYSVLVGRAAMYDYMTVYACYLAIIAGLGITLLLLAFYRKALPALPVSIALGVVFYVLTRTLLEAFLMQCSTNLLMF